MDAKGWTTFEAREPEESDCINGQLLVWHVFQGAFCIRYEKRHSNRFYTHWKALPGKGWTDSAKRKPSAEDADIHGCVLAKKDDGSMKITGWHQFDHEESYTHWMPTPEGPESAKEYRDKSWKELRDGGGW